MSLSYSIGWIASRAMFRFYFGMRVADADRVPLQGPVILASNHASFLDPLLVGAALHRELHYLARETLFQNPMVAAVLRSWNTVPVDRDGGGAAGLRVILDRLLGGAGIILFPEGTRTSDGKLQRARAGIGLAVIKSACPVVPVRVFGTFEAFGRHARFPRPKRVVVRFGAPLMFSDLRTEAEVCAKPRLKAIYQEVADELMAAIAALENPDRQG